MRRKFIVSVLSLGLILSAAAFASEIHLGISPEQELLAGVLAHTTWIEQRGPANGGNEYFRALQEFFAPYKDHSAVKIAQQLTSRGFTYDAPPAFIAHLGPLPELELTHEYSDYVLARAGGRERLEEFRLALKDLASESGFMNFFAEWEPYITEVVAECTAGFDPQRSKEWLEQFFGWQAANFHLILTAAMFPGGGYGVTVTTSDGETIAYQITRESGYSTSKPEFPTGESLEQLTVHELGHSFVNPSIEAYSSRVMRLKPLMYRVRNEMRSQAYTTAGTFINEQVLRAAEVLAARDLYGVEAVEPTITYNEERGFYLTRFVVEQLETYEENRNQYPTFREYVPHLLDELEEYQKRNCSFWEKLWGLWPF